MAILLIRTIDGENALRYMDGDVVAVLPDNHVFGRMESLEVWMSEGRNASDWPGGFAILEMTGLSVEAARQYVEEVSVMGVTEVELHTRRKHTIDYKALERRLPSSDRDTLRTKKRIKRNWADVQNLAKVKP